MGHLQQQIDGLLTIKPSNRKWHIALIAALGMGFPLLIGWYLGNMQYGLTASMSGLVIIYLPAQGTFTDRILTLLVCSFGFMASYAFGLFLSFNPILAVLGIGAFTYIVHWITLHYKTLPPRSFFFILLATLAICQPFQLHSIPTKLGLVGLGTMFSCIVGLVYTYYLYIKKHPSFNETGTPALYKNNSANSYEALVLALFIAASLAIGIAMKLNNPYWITISCAAVMQGASLTHIWQRSFQRILGTFIGLGLCWLILSASQNLLFYCIAIISLQFIVELLITRHYALAVIFITPMTILLAEAANPLIGNPNELITLRFTEIVIGSLLGAFGGWVLHKEMVRFTSKKSNSL